MFHVKHGMSRRRCGRDAGRRARSGSGSRSAGSRAGGRLGATRDPLPSRPLGRGVLRVPPQFTRAAGGHGAHTTCDARRRVRSWVCGAGRPRTACSTPQATWLCGRRRTTGRGTFHVKRWDAETRAIVLRCPSERAARLSHAVRGLPGLRSHGSAARTGAAARGAGRRVCRSQGAPCRGARIGHRKRTYRGTTRPHFAHRSA